MKNGTSHNTQSSQLRLRGLQERYKKSKKPKDKTIFVKWRFVKRSDYQRILVRGEFASVGKD